MVTRKKVVDNMALPWLGRGKGREEILNSKDKFEEANVGEN